jgi:hypothetical protein
MIWIHIIFWWSTWIKSMITAIEEDFANAFRLWI